MEQLQSISEIIAKLKIAYPYYFKELTKEELLGMASIYQETLGMYNKITIQKAINQIVRENQFMPTIKELIDKCEECISHEQNEIITKMINDNYFKNEREIEKAYRFLESKIIPSWFKEDMKKYGYQEIKLLEVSK